jgi:Flp pilus assembly protein TadG
MQKKSIVTCQRGASAVEFALLLPLLVLFVFGIIEFGAWFYDQAVITNASRVGARLGSVLYAVGGVSQDIQDDKIKTAVINACKDTAGKSRLITFGGPGISEDHITVEKVGSDPYRSVRVTINYPYNPLIMDNFLSFANTAIRGVTTMRMEKQTFP